MFKFYVCVLCTKLVLAAGTSFINALFQGEKAAKSRVERQCKELDRELQDLNERLEEAGGATAAQVSQAKSYCTRFEYGASR